MSLVCIDASLVFEQIEWWWWWWWWSCKSDHNDKLLSTVATFGFCLLCFWTAPARKVTAARLRGLINGVIPQRATKFEHFAFLEFVGRKTPEGASVFYISYDVPNFTIICQTSPPWGAKTSKSPPKNIWYQCCCCGNWIGRVDKHLSQLLQCSIQTSVCLWNVSWNTFAVNHRLLLLLGLDHSVTAIKST